jgi:hypothetical protein
MDNGARLWFRRPIVTRHTKQLGAVIHAGDDADLAFSLRCAMLST